MRAPLLGVALVSFLFVPRVASADPTKQECVDANEHAQILRKQGSLWTAREEAAVCLATSCPGPVREDCAERVAEIERAMPTIVFDVKDGTGQDVTDVALRVDGKLLASRLDGAPLPIDPGTHRLEFVREEGGTLDETLVVLEGQKDRREKVVIGGAA